MGHSAITAAGGAYVNVIETNSLKTTLFKLDSDNSAVIPYGSYTVLTVAFSGPGENAGTMTCGKFEAAIFNSPESTLTISMSATNCQQPIYAKTISTIFNKTGSLWDVGLWGSGKWGP